MSCPVELQNLIARVGYFQAKDLLRNWLEQSDRFDAEREAVESAWSAPIDDDDTDGLLPVPVPVAVPQPVVLNPEETGPDAVVPTSSELAAAEGLQQLSAASAAAPTVADCLLHGGQDDEAALGYSSNGSSYSFYSPPCNGCEHGQRDRAAGIWMSGFGPTQPEDTSPSYFS